MTVTRVMVLLGAAGVGLLVFLGYSFVRRRWGADVETLDVDELGLELMSGCCAFVVFTTPACAPCKAALRTVTLSAQSASAPTEVTTVDALDRSDLTARYNVRTIPTVFLITASGHVIRRWRDVPRPSDVDAALALL